VNTNDANASRGFRPSPVTLVRFSSILMVGLFLGHMSAYPWTSADDLQEKQLAGAMKGLDFIFMGQHQTYWNLYFGWGLLVGVFLLAMAIMLWVLASIARIDARRAATITGLVSAVCLIGFYISFRFFYLPPTIFFAVNAALLLGATVQLLSGETGRDRLAAGPRHSQT
jgi:hypothetical protein